MLDRKMAIPVLLRQAVDAQLPAETATIVDDPLVGQRREIDPTGNDIGLDRERAPARLVEPQIDAGKVAGRDRSPRQRAWCNLRHLALGVEEIHRRKARDAIARNADLALPPGFAPAPAIFRALPQHAHATAKIARRIGPEALRKHSPVEDVDLFERRGADDL